MRVTPPWGAAASGVTRGVCGATRNSTSIGSGSRTGSGAGISAGLDDVAPDTDMLDPATAWTAIESAMPRCTRLTSGATRAARVRLLGRCHALALAPTVA